ncbi:MAG TPA: GAF domain-containing protein [Leucothrix sp.]|nr:GAF domain-containing protein [Leucothrix sp.]
MSQSTTAHISLKSLESSLSGNAEGSLSRNAKGSLPVEGLLAKDVESLASDAPKLTEKTTTHFQRSLDKQELIVFPWAARVFLLVLLTLFIVIGATYFWAINTDHIPSWLAPVMTIMWLSAGAGVFFLLYWMWHQFSQFGKDLSVWANQLLQGDTSSRMLVRTERCPSKGIREHINAIAEDYESLSVLQQQRLTRQARHIEQKKYYLSVLYDVASCINQSHSLEDLLQRFLHTLTDVVNAEAATVRLLDKDDQMRLVASIGLSDEIVKKEELLPAPNCLCGKALSDTAVLIKSDVKQCGLIIGSDFFEGDDDIEMLAIPLQYRGKTLGVYNLFMKRKEHEFLDGEHELLLSIGKHLGMAIEQAGVEDDARTLSIIEERTRMAHELHDSLAQTLASLRFKVRLFDDSMNQGNEEVIWHELEGLENTIDVAYAELRSLITDFRAPIDGKGVVRAVKRLTQRFKQETDADVFFYHNWDLENLPRDIEIEVIRIVQEALANIKKHAKAKNIRILMSSTEDGHCSVLVEDDGVGLSDQRPEPNNKTGEHIGLSVMRERAERIKGEILFESEKGEGTLVQLSFDVKPESNSVTSNALSKLKRHQNHNDSPIKFYKTP